MTWKFSYEELGLTSKRYPDYLTRVIHSSEETVFFGLMPLIFDPPIHSLMEYIAVYRLNLHTGEIKPSAYPYQNKLLSYSVSPPGDRIVYAEPSKPIKLFIYRGSRPGILPLDAQYDQAGEFVWSEDGTKLVFKLSNNVGLCHQVIEIRLITFTNAPYTVQDFYERSVKTLINDLLIDTCQPKDFSFYTRAVDDEFVYFEHIDHLYQIGLSDQINYINLMESVSAIKITPTPTSTPTPFPYEPDNPVVQSIARTLYRRREIFVSLVCNHDLDIDILEEVFLDTPDYEITEHKKIMITVFLGEEALKDAGYLTYNKAYHLWDKTGLLQPESLTDTPAPRTGFKECDYMDVLDPPEISISEVELFDDYAIVKYKDPPYYLETTLKLFYGKWYIIRDKVTGSTF